MPYLRVARVALFVLAFGFTTPIASGVPGDGASPAASEDAVRAASAFGLPAGFVAECFANEPDVQNPVAFSVDERGAVYVCETFRQKRGVTDNRQHDRTWVDADLAAQTVADRIAYHRRLLGDQVGAYERHEDRVRRLVDTDGDGRAERSEVFAAEFSRLEDGTAAGILARRGTVWLTCIPSLYRLRDLDFNGSVDASPQEREVLSTGYGVRVAYRGHDLHGLTLGPDGRIYFSIGDRGFHVEHDGRIDADPGRGAVFRCEPDGSRLEIVAHGLRNPQELAFDDLGNLFTVDNNSDGGDKSRVVHLLHAADAGWRMEYQYFADRGPWHRERIWHLENDDQPAFCLPPVAHLGAGPSGFAADLGTGLTPHFRGRFFLVDFRGGAANSCVHSFRFAPEGGSFTIADEEETITNVLATDVEVGPDGALWLSDWVHGWEGDGRGRIWRFRPRDVPAADAAIVAEVRRLLAGDWSAISAAQLVTLLGHRDRRIRLESQWELVHRRAEDEMRRVLTTMAADPLARVHAAQGLAQLLRQGVAETAAALVSVARDPDAGVRQVVARVLGDCPPDLACRGEVRRVLADQLADADLHVVTAAATSLGRLGRRAGDDTSVMSAISTLASSPAARDRAVRHCAAMAIAGVAAAADLDALIASPSSEVRLIACVALRRLRDDRLAALLDDANDAVATEAARAIHDLPVAPLLTKLAASAASGPAADAFLRRAISAAEQVGTRESAESLVEVIARTDASTETRQEAIAALDSWADPPHRNRVTGVWLPQATQRPSSPAHDAVAAALHRLVGPQSIGLDGELATAVLVAASRLGVAEAAPLLRDQATERSVSAASRSRALDALLAADDAEALAIADRLITDPESRVRMAARRVRFTHAPTDAIVPDLVAACTAGDVAERQQAVDLLAEVATDAARQAIATLAGQLRDGTIDPAIALEVKSAVAKRLGSVPAAAGAVDPLAAWSDVVKGGDADRGRRIFFDREEVSCVRCHYAEGKGGEVGPKLDGIAITRDPRYLLESIVDPAARVAEGYATSVIVTDEGRIVSGIVVAETPDAITLKLPDGTTTVIPATAVEDRASGPSSMPADLAEKLTRRELRDLLAWLQGLR